MCGIYGYFSKSSDFSFSEAEMNNMAQRIVHRGPDGVGYYTNDGKAGLGNVRLAIIDPEGGDQPFFSRDGNVVLVQNGEIFNFQELKAELIRGGVTFKSNSDTEVLLELYLRDGVAFLDRLNGMFAIAIYHIRENRMILARDRIGEKPLYYSQSETACFFSSEIKSFLPYIENKLNLTAVDALLNLNYVPAPLTVFQDVLHVMPGHYLEISEAGITDVEWWDLATQTARTDWTKEEWQSEFLDLMKDCVSARLVSDVPFGAFLSGGVDSSTVVGFMSELMDEPVKTYTIGFPDKRFDESEYAETASKRFGTNHLVEEVNYNIVDEWSDFVYFCDQPHGDVSFLPMRKVASLAARDVKMVLTGDGADELFAGYEKYATFAEKRAESDGGDETFLDSLFPELTLFDAQDRKRLWKEDRLEEVDLDASYQLFREALDRVPHFDEINKMLYLEMRFLLSGNNLVKPDRMAMAESLETRAPFLDYRMMEFAFQTPGDFKLLNGDKKYLFKRSVTDLIGEDLAFRKKQMFTMPIGEWFKAELSAYCNEILLSNTTRLHDLFNRDIIRELLDEHLSGKANHTRQIRVLISIELWLRRFQ